MVNGAFFFSARPLYLCLQGRNSGIQLRNGQGIKILPQQHYQRVIRLTGKDLVHVHERES